MITERVELIKFDEKAYYKEAEKTYAMRKEVEDIADAIAKKGFKNIFLLGIGGTEFEFVHFEYLMKKNSNLDVCAINAAEANAIRPKGLCKDSLVITASASGDTKEIVEAAEWMSKEGIFIVAFTQKEKALGQIAQTVVDITGLEQIETICSVQAFFIYRLMNRCGYFENYEKFADQLKKVYANLVDIRKVFEPKADEIAKKLYDAPYTIFTGSGPLWGEVVMFSMCMLEEMQWKRTRPVKSSQFFHGTLELVEPGVPVFIVKGEDENRVLDNRVEEFCKKINAEYYVIDTKEYALDIDEEFREYIAPWVVSVLLVDRLSAYYECYTKHNLHYRRYYRQFDY